MDQSVLDHNSSLGDVQQQQQLIGIHTLDVTFQPMKLGLEKSLGLLAIPLSSCALCQQSINATGSMALVCMTDGCDSPYHMSCLSRHFLDAEENSTAVLPTEGKCPSCGTGLHWTDLVRNLSLRMRGVKEMEALFKQPKSRSKSATLLSTETVAVDQDESDEALSVDDSDDDLDPTELMLSLEIQGIEDTPLAQRQGDRLRIDNAIAQTKPRQRSPRERAKSSRHPSTSTKRSTRRSETVIEDSDWDEAEIIE